MPAGSRGHRFAGRARVVARALAKRVSTLGRRKAPREPRRILIAHQLLLGDTLMLTSLLAKLRAQHPAADIVMALPEAFASLYQSAPYGVRALGWNPRTPARSPLWRERAFDIAFVPGDNRVSWLALALGSRWIVGFGGDRPARKSWPFDELHRYPDVPAAWTDMVATLAHGAPPAPYARRDWSDPAADPFELPRGRYAVLHVGASTPLKRWESDKWRALAAWLAARGIEPVWSAGRGEEAVVRECDPDARHRSYAGALTLPQLWRLLANAVAAGRPRHRCCPSGTRRLGADSRALRSGLGVDQRRRRVLARRAVSRGDGRSVSLPRSAAVVQARDRLGAPVWAHHCRMSTAALHGSDRSGAELRRDRRSRRGDRVIVA